ncbi:MAG: hypothetical protein KAG64_02915 [Bacteroidales bacterium]|nr:hypothetical protein [Bacteroidales bacterium]
MYLRLILLISIILPLTVFSQNLKKAFKLFEEGQPIEAAVIFDEAKDDPAMKSAGYYGLALIESTESRRGNDMYKAFNHIVKAEKFSDDMNPKIVKKISDYYSIEKVKAERKRIDAKLYADVQKKKEIPLVDRFIKECEESDYFLQVLALKATLEYVKVREYDTERDYIAFINYFPESKEAADAKLRLNTLAWRKTVEENSIASYSLFIKNYSDAPQLDSAKTSLMGLEYKKVLVLNTSAAFKKFIDKYPDTEMARALEAKRVKMLYDQAVAIGTFDAFQYFIDSYPPSIYTPAAEKSRDSLAFLEARELNTSLSYRNFVNAYPNSLQLPMAMVLLGNMSFSVAEISYMKKIDAIRKLHIKSFSAFRISEDDSSMIIVEKLVSYDTLGHELTNLLQAAKGMKTEIKCEYNDAADRLMSKKVFINDKLQKESSYVYFNEGLIKTESVILYFDRGDYPAEYISIYQYDSLRNLTFKQDSAIMDSTVIAIHSYQYDKNKLLVSSLTKNGDSLIATVTFRYNGKKNLVEKTTKNHNEKILEVVSFTYNDRGQKLSKKIFNAYGTIEHKYEYGVGNTIEAESVDIENSKEHFRLGYKYEYFK